MKKKPLQTTIVQAMNKAGLSDMNGDLYNTHGPAIVRFVLKMVRRRSCQKHLAADNAALRLELKACHELFQRCINEQHHFASMMLGLVSVRMENIRGTLADPQWASRGNSLAAQKKRAAIRREQEGHARIIELLGRIPAGALNRWPTLQEEIRVALNTVKISR